MKIYHFLNINNLKELEIYEVQLIDDNALDNLFNIFNEFNQNLIKLHIELFKFKNYLYDKEIKIKNNIELKNLKDFCFKYSDINKNYFEIKRYKINKLNIDKCINLEKIHIPYYFECNNIDILNNLKTIKIDYLENNNINFLNQILSYKKLNNLNIVFLLPIKNNNIIKILIDNINKIQKIKCKLYLNVTGIVQDSNRTFEIKSKTEKNSEKKYFKEFNKIINEQKIIFNYLKKFDIFSNNKKLYKEFRNINYFGKIKYLENFPVI